MGANVYPIMSFYAYDICRNNSNKFIEQIESITNKKIIYLLDEAESLPNKINADIMIIAPCSGNTIAKLSNAITDTPVTICAKTNIKNKKPIVIFIYTNDGLSTNFCNIANLINRKHIFIVPFRQENPITKPYALSSDPEYIVQTINFALENEQIQPLFL